MILRLAVLLLPLLTAYAQPETRPAPWIDSRNWARLSSETGELPAPGIGRQQTASLVADLDRSGVNDFIITDRTQAPAAVWYRKTASGWSRFVIDTSLVLIEAGSAVHDIDSDGDLDVVFGGEARSSEVWWWENPYPDYDPDVPWTRRTIKRTGRRKHHDQLFGDFDADGRSELAFWNQESGTLFLAEIPEDPRRTTEWNRRPIYSYSSDGQMAQRGTYPKWKRINEHEGLASADIDGDGTLDLVAGGRWFKHQADGSFMPNLVDGGYTFTRAAAGQLIEGGRPEIVLLAGDGTAPLMMYEYRQGTWVGTELARNVQDGHSVAVLDFNEDGHQDIFVAEMNLGQNPDARTALYLGDGKGGFTEQEVARGYDLHEARMADLDGDGDLDILAKPYNDQTPRIEVWLNRRR